MDNLRIIQWNSNGIPNQTQELQILENNLEVDIILLCETYINST